MTTARPLDSEELASTAPERELLEAFIDAYRDVVIAKLRGLSEDDARRGLVPSLTTLIGLVKHAAVNPLESWRTRLCGLVLQDVGG
ncbi:DUF664 domain-containing protein [Micromonospora peucetia]|uniref:mycothiol transferase n=1 Tax=Micromonospora peucetia TaxID=47871 RepID=UPI003EBEC574